MTSASIVTQSTNTGTDSDLSNRNDVFISYSRKDKEFVQTLDTAFRHLNRDPWVDWDDIHPTEDWWQAIEAGIEGADTFVFVMTPDSIASTVCRQEVEHAVKHNKRLVPLVRREGFPGDAVHPALSRHNWVFFRDSDDFNQAFQRLLEALDTDLEHVHAHTRLLVRAIEWNKKDRNESFLLRGTDLTDAETWLTQSSGKQPQPTSLQGEYINTSRQVETAHQRAAIRQQRLFTAGVGVFACMALVAAGVALYLWQEAQKTNARLRQKEVVLEQITKSLMDSQDKLTTTTNAITLLNERYANVKKGLRTVVAGKLSAAALLAQIDLDDNPKTPVNQQQKQRAWNLIEQWLSAKKEIFGKDYQTQQLAELTTGDRLKRAQLAVDWLQLNNAHYTYGTPQVKDFKLIAADANQIICEVTETESVNYYVNGSQRPTPAGQSGTRRSRYILENVNGTWKIADSQTID